MSTLQSDAKKMTLQNFFREIEFHHFFSGGENETATGNKTTLCNHFYVSIFFCLRQHTYIEIFAEFLQSSANIFFKKRKEK